MTLRTADIGRVCLGSPGPTLAGMAVLEHAVLLVVGASRRARGARALRGSVTDYLVRRAECPVVVCPRDAVAADAVVG